MLLQRCYAQHDAVQAGAASGRHYITGSKAGTAAEQQAAALQMLHGSALGIDMLGQLSRERCAFCRCLPWRLPQ